MTDLTPEDLLLAATQRALRTPKGRVALVLHLSALTPPAPRRYHRRIALAILDEAAGRHAGTVFLLRCGDAALLCRQPTGPPSPDAALIEPAVLPHTLAQLFRADVPPVDGPPLTSLWALDIQGEALLAYALAARAARPDPAAAA